MAERHLNQFFWEFPAFQKRLRHFAVIRLMECAFSIAKAAMTFPRECDHFFIIIMGVLIK